MTKPKPKEPQPPQPQRTFIHPGYVRSKNDGDEHFISFMKLCELYQVNPNEVTNAALGFGRGFIPRASDRHLYPRVDGKYPIFEKRDDNAEG